MADSLTPLENEALRLLLAGDGPVFETLREQEAYVIGVRRSCSGVGTFADFDLSADVPRLVGSPSLVISDVVFEAEGLKFGGGFVLFINDGVLGCLEAYTFDDPWPEEMGRFGVRYATGRERDFETLRRERERRPSSDTGGEAACGEDAV